MFVLHSLCTAENVYDGGRSEIISPAVLIVVAIAGIAGNVVLPFIDRFPKDTELYRVMTTKPEEVGDA